MLNVSAGKFRGFGLVRDKDGKPKVDDPDSLPQEIRDILTDEEYLEILGEERKR